MPVYAVKEIEFSYRAYFNIPLDGAVAISLRTRRRAWTRPAGPLWHPSPLARIGPRCFAAEHLLSDLPESVADTHFEFLAQVEELRPQQDMVLETALDRVMDMFRASRGHVTQRICALCMHHGGRMCNLFPVLQSWTLIMPTVSSVLWPGPHAWTSTGAARTFS